MIPLKKALNKTEWKKPERRGGVTAGAAAAEGAGRKGMQHPHGMTGGGHSAWAGAEPPRCATRPRVPAFAIPAHRALLPMRAFAAARCVRVCGASLLWAAACWQARCDTRAGQPARAQRGCCPPIGRACWREPASTQKQRAGSAAPRAALCETDGGARGQAQHLPDVRGDH
jgi:hypothetical protein